MFARLACEICGGMCTGRYSCDVCAVPFCMGCHLVQSKCNDCIDRENAVEDFQEQLWEAKELADYLDLNE